MEIKYRIRHWSGVLYLRYVSIHFTFAKFLTCSYKPIHPILPFQFFSFKILVLCISSTILTLRIIHFKNADQFTTKTF